MSRRLRVEVGSELRVWGEGGGRRTKGSDERRESDFPSFHILSLASKGKKRGSSSFFSSFPPTIIPLLSSKKRVLLPSFLLQNNNQANLKAQLTMFPSSLLSLASLLLVPFSALASPITNLDVRAGGPITTVKVQVQVSISL